METIDYKEKYEQALEVAQRFYNNSVAITKKGLEDIFPELAESDDERIRKWCISHFKECINVIKDNDEYKEYLSNKVIAWLEKQGERGTNGNDREIPNSAWSEEDEENMMMIEDRLSDYLDYIREDTSLTKLNKNSMKEEIIEYVNWLKSLKERVQPQPKQQWSEEDEKMCNDTIQFIEKGWTDNGKSHLIPWLKSLKERYIWKPSNGQLECLGYAIEKAEKDWSPLTNNRIYLTLKALKEQLLELRGSKV